MLPAICFSNLRSISEMPAFSRKHQSTRFNVEQISSPRSFKSGLAAIRRRRSTAHALWFQRDGVGPGIATTLA